MRTRFRPSARSGSTLAIVAVMLAGLMAVLALSLDVGMMLTAHREAQRVADSAALAGASAFLDFLPADAVVPARDRAHEYAYQNEIRKDLVQPGEDSVVVLPDSMKVRVWVRRRGLPTWFARLFGINEVAVSAIAAAAVFDAGSAKCLKPFAVPDVWDEKQDDTNGNHIWDPGENWLFDPAVDRYARYTGPSGSPDETGYGSAWRDAADPNVKSDYGREISLKLSDPNSEYTPAPSVFLPWRLPVDPTQQDCAKGGGGLSEPGAAAYRRNICSCNTSPIVLGQDYPIETGNMIGPTDQGVDELIGKDPAAQWDEASHAVTGSTFGENWMASPRVVKVAMFDPTQIQGSGMQTIQFNNFALFFIEQHTSLKAPVVGRFLFYVNGDEQGPIRGSLVKVLRLVE